MFIGMLLAFLFGIICILISIKECFQKNITGKNIGIAIIGVILIGFAIYLALPHYS